MTAAVAQIPKKAPMPVDVDERAEQFHQLELDLEEAQKKSKEAQKAVTEKELELVELVRAYGGPHATKSKILHGIAWEMVATFAQYSTLDAAAVERFRTALVEAGQSRLMKKLFTESTRWNLNGDAAEVVKTEKLSAKLLGLLIQCTVTGDKKPSLDVRPKKKPSGSAA
jgi:hypothetical protein